MSKRVRRTTNQPPDLPGDRSAGAEPERLPLDAIADGALDHSLHAVADAVHARLALLQSLQRPIGRFTTGEIRCPPLALERIAPAP